MFPQQTDADVFRHSMGFLMAINSSHYHNLIMIGRAWAHTWARTTYSLAELFNGRKPLHLLSKSKGWGVTRHAVLSIIMATINIFDMFSPIGLSTILIPFQEFRERNAVTGPFCENLWKDDIHNIIAVMLT